MELRQYTLVPGGRDTLVDVFDRYLVAGQEADGMEIVGQFRDLDDPERFVWLRGFPSMAGHGAALAAFYGGPVWRAHRTVANATMIDSDNVLLLEPLDRDVVKLRSAASNFAASVIGIEVAYLDGPVTTADRAVARAAAAALSTARVEVLGVFTTHVADNDFPGLPLREENVLVWVFRATDDSSYSSHREELGRSPGWLGATQSVEARGNGLPMQHLRLRPTAGSRLR
jgi:NIPSNAP